MQKNVKDLTLSEMKHLCKDVYKKQCSKCPLYIYVNFYTEVYCLFSKNTDELLNQTIEVPNE